MSGIRTFIVPPVNNITAGMILMWSGLIANIPSGFHICDGTNGTPDLRSRFVRGAPAGNQAGATGGEDTHVLTVAEMPSHTHTIQLYSGGTSNVNNIDTVGTNTPAGSATSDSTGGGIAHENRPAYFELIFIMKL